MIFLMKNIFFCLAAFGVLENTWGADDDDLDSLTSSGGIPFVPKVGGEDCEIQTMRQNVWGQLYNNSLYQIGKGRDILSGLFSAEKDVLDYVTNKEKESLVLTYYMQRLLFHRQLSGLKTHMVDSLDFPEYRAALDVGIEVIRRQCEETKKAESKKPSIDPFEFERK